MKIIGPTFSAGLTPMTIWTNRAAFKINHLTDNSQLALSISPVGNAKSQLLERFRAALNPDASPASYLPSYAETYAKLREEILGGESDTQEMSLKLLDEVYGEVTGEAADRLADRFDAFFNGPDKLLDRYRMPSMPSVFDRDSFRNHLTQLAEEARQLALAHPGEAAAYLERSGPADTLESMSFRDIKALSGALADIGALRPPIAVGNDPDKFGAAVANWEAESRRILDAAGLSDRVKNAASKTLHDSSQARLKTGAYALAVDSYQSKIDETLKKLSHLSYLISTINGKLNELKGLDPRDPRLQNLLRREQELEKERADYSSELKSDKASLKKLENDPDSVESSDTYRRAKSAYDNASNKGSGQ